MIAMMRAVTHAAVLAEEPFANTIAGRIFIPVIATMLGAAILGGIAWARYITKSLQTSTTVAASNAKAAEDNARDVRELVVSVKEIATSSQQLAISSAVTADALTRHLNSHP